MIRPSMRAVMIFASSVPVSLIIVVLKREWWFVSLYIPFILFVFMLVDLIMSMPLFRMNISLKTPSFIYVGQTGFCNLDATCGAAVRNTEIDIMLDFGQEWRMITAPSAILKVVMEKENLLLNIPVKPDRRGRVIIESLWLRWKGPLKLLNMYKIAYINSSIDVVHDVKGICHDGLRFFSNDAIHGRKIQRLKGEGTEFESLCEYSQGMDSRTIDWKHSARHRKLLCKEFNQERNYNIILGFDTGHLMLESVDGISKLDLSIKAGLLLSWFSLNSGDLVGGCGFDSKFGSYIKPGRGTSYFQQFQKFTAGLDYSEEETNYTLCLSTLSSKLEKRTLIILFTDFIDQVSAELLIECLQVMAKKHVIIFVALKDVLLERLENNSPESFADVSNTVIASDFSKERSVVIERIERMGIHCLDVPAGGISAALINKYLTIKQRGLL